MLRRVPPRPLLLSAALLPALALSACPGSPAPSGLEQR